MRTGHVSSIVLACGLIMCSATAPPADASVLGITINDYSTGDFTLTSVTVNRGPGGVVTYTPDQLIGVSLTDIAATGSTLVTPLGQPVPPPGSRAGLLEDHRLDTGLINPFSTGAPADQSFEVTFNAPVVNAAGADILVFEIGAGDPTAFWVHNDRDNHRHDVAATAFSRNLITGMPFTQYAYSNPNGGSNVLGLAALESETGWDNPGSNGTTAIAAIALDLSDFGVPLGETVTSLRWQTTSVGSRIDTVLVAGLPSVPEPGSVALLGLPGLWLLVRRRGVRDAT